MSLDHSVHDDHADGLGKGTGKYSGESKTAKHPASTSLLARTPRDGDDLA